MYNSTDFTVNCRLIPGTKGFFRVYYVKIDGNWQPLPIDVCDNGCNDKRCLDCVKSVFEKAQSHQPPFLR